MEMRGMARPDLIAASGVSKQALSNWVSGKNEPNLRQLRKVAAAIGVSISYLAGEDVRERDDRHSPEASELVQKIGNLGLGEAARSISSACPDLLDLLTEAEELARGYRGKPASESD
jgi:transcriptional regulator with XRE-family HTH domain